PPTSDRGSGAPRRFRLFPQAKLRTGPPVGAGVSPGGVIRELPVLACGVAFHRRRLRPISELWGWAMTIRLQCPCGQDLRVKYHLAGKSISCPKCGQRLAVPGSETEFAPSQERMS